ncbi:unnamed protein product, partial [Didymodactylos carnosus]
MFTPVHSILFPLFWLCSVFSYFLTKLAHTTVYNYVERYIIKIYYPNYNLEDEKKVQRLQKYVWQSTFAFLILLQCLFLLTPSAVTVASVKDRNQPQTSSSALNDITNKAFEQQSLIEQQKLNINNKESVSKNKPINKISLTNTNDNDDNTAFSFDIQHLMQPFSMNFYERFISMFSDYNLNDDNALFVAQRDFKGQQNVRKHTKETLQSLSQTSNSKPSNEDKNSEMDSSNDKIEHLTRTVEGNLRNLKEQTRDIREKIITIIQPAVNSAQSVKGRFVANDEIDESDLEPNHDNTKESSILINVKEKLKQNEENINDTMEEKLNTAKKQIIKPSTTSIIDNMQENVILKKSMEKNIEDKVDELQARGSSVMDKVKESAHRLKKTIDKMVKTKVKSIVSSSEKKQKSTSSDINHKVVKEKRRPVKESMAKKMKNKLSKLTHSGTKNDEDKSVIDKMKNKAKSLKNSFKLEKSSMAKIMNEKLRSIIKSENDENDKPSATENARDKVRSLETSAKKSSIINKVKKNVNSIMNQTKIYFKHLFFSSTFSSESLSETSHLYTAYTDLKCFNYTKQRYRIWNKSHKQFLNKYRRYVPFEVYLNLIQTQGPVCYSDYSNSSCAFFLYSQQHQGFKTTLKKMILFWFVICAFIVIIALALAVNRQDQYTKHSSDRTRYHNESYYDIGGGGGDGSNNRRTQKNKQLIQNTFYDVSDVHYDRQIASSFDTSAKTLTISHNNNINVDEEIMKHLKLWLKREQDTNYRYIIDECQRAFNNASNKLKSL